MADLFCNWQVSNFESSGSHRLTWWSWVTEKGKGWKRNFSCNLFEGCNVRFCALVSIQLELRSRSNVIQ